MLVRGVNAVVNGLAVGPVAGLEAWILCGHVVP
jgi:hypothetical protein